MKYTVFTRQQVEPQWIVVNEAVGTSSRLNPGPQPNYPATFLRLIVRCKDFDLYSDNPIRRQELWEDLSGVATDGEIAPFMAIVYAEQIECLWKSATRWQETYISGLASGLLTMGVLMGKPKALAIMQWSGALWGEYYIRKASILASGEVNYDFSDCGQMPYSIPELRAELGL